MPSNTGQRSGKADPNCPDCHGCGVEIGRMYGSCGRLFQTTRTRCPCTNLPPANLTTPTERDKHHEHTPKTPI